MKNELNFIMPDVLTFPSCLTPLLIFFFFASSSSLFRFFVASLSSASSSFIVLRLRDMLSDSERSAAARLLASAMKARWVSRGVKSVGEEEHARSVFKGAWREVGM